MDSVDLSVRSMAAAASSAGKKARECRVCADFSSWSKAQAAREEVVKCACVCTRVCARNRVYHECTSPLYILNSFTVW